MEKNGLGILCQECSKCKHYASYPTSNGAIPRCELDNLCLSLGPKGIMVDDHCPSFKPLFPEKVTTDTFHK